MAELQSFATGLLGGYTKTRNAADEANRLADEKADALKREAQATARANAAVFIGIEDKARAAGDWDRAVSARKESNKELAKAGLDPMGELSPSVDDIHGWVKGHIGPGDFKRAREMVNSKFANFPNVLKEYWDTAGVPSDGTPVEQAAAGGSDIPGTSLNPAPVAPPAPVIPANPAIPPPSMGVDPAVAGVLAGAPPVAPAGASGVHPAVAGILNGLSPLQLAAKGPDLSVLRGGPAAPSTPLTIPPPSVQAPRVPTTPGMDAWQEALMANYRAANPNYDKADLAQKRFRLSQVQSWVDRGMTPKAIMDDWNRDFGDEDPMTYDQALEYTKSRKSQLLGAQVDQSRAGTDYTQARTESLTNFVNPNIAARTAFMEGPQTDLANANVGLINARARAIPKELELDAQRIEQGYAAITQRAQAAFAAGQDRDAVQAWHNEQLKLDIQNSLRGRADDARKLKMGYEKLAVDAGSLLGANNPQLAKKYQDIADSIVVPDSAPAPYVRTTGPAPQKPQKAASGAQQALHKWMATGTTPQEIAKKKAWVNGMASGNNKWGQKFTPEQIANLVGGL